VRLIRELEKRDLDRLSWATLETAAHGSRGKGKLHYVWTRGSV